MSVKIIAGRTGSGKSAYICDVISKAATENPEQSYLVIVPDQFTMQTQADFVAKSKRGGIMNIEVLSFMRLAHRVFEETGGADRPVLDDTGKNLILRKCADAVADRIPYLAGKLNKPGYIHEVKSAISEFMQYGVNDEQLTSLVRYAREGNRITLANKLGDLSVLYVQFKEYIKEKYITTEESMDILAEDIYRSVTVKDSIVIFDGFTGFTPVQNRVLEAIMDVAKDVIFTLTIDSDKLSTEIVNESDIFALTHKTYLSLKRLAKDHGYETEIIPMKTAYRYESSPELSFMEEHFYRYDGAQYNNACNNIFLSANPNIRADVRTLASDIRELIVNENAYYRDIAVITGNPDAYLSEFEEVFEEYDIPVYFDRNRHIEQNPFIEYIKAALGLFVWDYDYDCVFRMLKTGFAEMDDEDIDRLDNYITETGIRGRAAYNKPFAKKTRKLRQSGDDLSELDSLNKLREHINDILAPFTDTGIAIKKNLSASTYVKALYEFILRSDCDKKLKVYEQMFNEAGEYAEGREYAQIYRYICELLEQIDALIGSESLDPFEFYKLLEAGMAEIKVGTIPQSVDRVIVGDMERTRLKSVKYLFFLGLNDGWVPKSTGVGGIISDSDREFLCGYDVELAPSPRQQAYIDRFYLYSNLCKPSKRLYLSYVLTDNELNALKPSYMLNHIRNLFPSLMQREVTAIMPDCIGSYKEAKLAYADYIREYASGTANEDDEKKLRQLYPIVSEDTGFADRMLENAFKRFENARLDDKIAAVLYGSGIYASVSRIEKYAACAYSYFLQYTMGLKERERYGIESTDMGTIYHGVLEIFTDLLKSRGLTWFDFDDETAVSLIDEAVDKESVKYTDAILFESESNKYIVSRMKAVMLKTVKTIAYQLRKSSFVPYEYEYEFDRSLKDNNVSVKLTGKIDRLDVADTDKGLMLKVIDYKSGNKNFSLLNLYEGRQLQMVVYMNGAYEAMKEKFPDKNIIPAAMLYYHINDPVVEAEGDISDEAVNKLIITSLRQRGIIDDDDDVVLSLDNSGAQDSDVICVSRKKDGSYKKNSEVMSREDMAVISEYADYKLLETAKRMASGDISADPKIIGSGVNKSDSCTYCKFAGICGFDIHMPGACKQVTDAPSDEELLSLMKDKLNAKEGNNA